MSSSPRPAQHVAVSTAAARNIESPTPKLSALHVVASFRMSVEQLQHPTLRIRWGAASVAAAKTFPSRQRAAQVLSCRWYWVRLGS